jgi:ubiquinone/menaquinone biosynthesis C-methylase UbiE
MEHPELHWRNVWASKAPDQVSWFERDPATSLDLIGAVAPSRDSKIVDVGGGASLLVDRLLDSGYEGVVVVDISEAALDLARSRLGDRGARVAWTVADARDLRLPEPVDVWHDRAVFHFLTEEADRGAYLASARRSLRVGGHVVMATFAPGGPERCSGLPVQRYDPAMLAQQFGPDFQLLQAFTKEHVTPAGASQPFTHVVMRRLR